MTMKIPTFGPIVLQYLLITLIMILIAGVAGVFAAAHRYVGEQARATDHARTDAELAQEEITRLKQLKVSLADSQKEINKAAQIVADSQMYQYQDQIITDLTTYAEQSGVEVVNFDFGPNSATTTRPSSSSSTIPAGLKKTLVKVSLKSNINYESFLRFLKSIENNVTKMQLTGIFLVPDPKNRATIQGPVIEVEVYVR